MRVLHIQIGVDGVLEEMHRDLIRFCNLSKSSVGVDLLPDASFDAHLKEAINLAKYTDGDTLLDHEMRDAQSIIVSRPKFLYSGKPMNLDSYKVDATYKISTLQSFFSSTRIVFHLFVTDHVSYLYSHLEWLRKNGADRPFTWVPLIESIRSKLTEPNKLCVWNAESANNTRSDYVAELFGASETDVDQFFTLEGSEPGSSAKLHSIVERDLLSVGADVHALDDAFETDLERLQL